MPRITVTSPGGTVVRDEEFEWSTDWAKDLPAPTEPVEMESNDAFFKRIREEQEAEDEKEKVRQSVNVCTCHLTCLCPVHDADFLKCSL